MIELDGVALAAAVVALGACGRCDDDAVRAPEQPSGAEAETAAEPPFRTNLELWSPDDQRVVGVYVEVHDVPPRSAASLRYGEPIPETRRPEDELGVVVGIPIVREGAEPIGLGGDRAPPRSFTLPSAAGAPLSVLLVRGGDVTSVERLSCARDPCPAHQTAAADVALLLPLEAVAQHALGPGWRFVIEP